MKLIAAMSIAFFLAGDSLSIHPRVPVIGKGSVRAIRVGSSVTSGAVGGRFQLVDTLWVSVISGASINLHTGVYRYNYVVINDRRSLGSLETFELVGVTAPITEVTAAPHWRLLSLPSKSDPRVIWVADLGNPPPGWIDDGVSLYESEFAILPGDSAIGFGFVSLVEPSRIQYRIRPYEPIGTLEDFIPYCDAEVIGEARGPVLSDSSATPRTR
jgi:hypothetical protein